MSDANRAQLPGPGDPLYIPLRRSMDGIRSLIDKLRILIRFDEPIPSALPPVVAKPIAVAPVLVMPSEPIKARAPLTPPTPSATFVDEDGDEAGIPDVFATATMGHLLLDQDRPVEARRVFDAVLARHRHDPEALRGLQRLGATVNTPSDSKPAETPRAAPAVDGATPEPAGMLDRELPPADYGVVEARALAVDPSSIVVFWEIPEAALAEATRRAGAGAVRTLCVVSIRSGDNGLERHERYVDDVPALGDWFVSGLPTGAHHHAAIGLRRGSLFVAIVHAEPVETPRGSPHAALAEVRATVTFGDAADGSTPPGPMIDALTGPRDALTRVMARGQVRAGRLIETPIASAYGDEGWQHTHEAWTAGRAPSSEGPVKMEHSSSSR